MIWANLKLTESAAGNAALSPDLPAGVYGEGMLTLPSTEDATGLTEAMEWTLDGEPSVVAHNAFGDLFLRMPDKPEIYYLWLQYGTGRQIASSIHALERLLRDNDADRSKFLEVAAFDSVKARLGPLPYGSVYTHVPLLCLGGTGDLQSCSSGRLETYISIVSQSL